MAKHFSNYGMAVYITAAVAASMTKEKLEREYE